MGFQSQHYWRVGEDVDLVDRFRAAGSDLGCVGLESTKAAGSGLSITTRRGRRSRESATEIGSHLASSALEKRIGDKDIVGVRIRGAPAERGVLDFESLHNAKGFARMPDIKPLPPLPRTRSVFVAAMGGASQLRCCELAEQTGCRQSVHR
jgi:hypothetical protein